MIEIPRGSRVFVLTGAGVSAESGIRTFRDANGLWEDHAVEDVASPEGWERDPALVWRFYSERRRQAKAVSPNPAHAALARLEEQLGDGFFLCTQNVDALHEAAGSRRLVHMHGELSRSRCENPGCDLPPFADEGLYFTLEDIPRCPRCGARIRPHIVWFGEMPFELERTWQVLGACDLFVTVGSSGVVHPAAGFVREIRQRQLQGEHPRSVYVGVERPANASAFDEVVLGRAGEVLPGLFGVRPA